MSCENKFLPDKELLISRLVIAGVCLGAIATAIYAPSDIFTRVLFAWAALGAAFGPIIIGRRAGLAHRRLCNVECNDDRLPAYNIIPERLLMLESGRYWRHS